MMNQRFRLRPGSETPNGFPDDLGQKAPIARKSRMIDNRPSNRTKRKIALPGPGQKWLMQK
jgi:hypothetical protein